MDWEGCNSALNCSVMEQYSAELHCWFQKVYTVAPLSRFAQENSSYRDPFLSYIHLDYNNVSNLKSVWRLQLMQKAVARLLVRGSFWEHVI